MTTTIDGIEIGVGLPCRFVAEISNNHNGQITLAIALLDAAKASGADFAKVQCYTPDELVALRGNGLAPEPWGAQGWTMRSLYEHAMTPRGFFEPMCQHAARIGLPLFASVFGEESLELMESFGCPAYKMARLDNAESPLFAAMQRTGKPIIVSGTEDDLGLESVSMSDLRLYCPPGYPQPSDTPWPRNYIGPWDGLSYHGMDPVVGYMASQRGASLIEAHLQLDTPRSNLEANVSLTPAQFSAMAGF